MNDKILSPSHYHRDGIECIDAMKQVFGEDAMKLWGRMQCFKYMWRHRYKEDEESDMKKHLFYSLVAAGYDAREAIPSLEKIYDK